MAKRDNDKPLKADTSQKKDGTVPVNSPEEIRVPTEKSWKGLWSKGGEKS